MAKTKHEGHEGAEVMAQQKLVLHSSQMTNETYRDLQAALRKVGVRTSLGRRKDVWEITFTPMTQGAGTDRR